MDRYNCRLPTHLFPGVTRFTQIFVKRQLGDSSEEASKLLYKIGEQSNSVGFLLNTINARIAAFDDGHLTQDKLIIFIGDEVIGGAIGTVPFVGGVLGAFTTCQEQMIMSKIR